MPSPFPGMDPFLESAEWPDFHHAFIEAVREELNRQLPAHYLVRVERRVYVEYDDEPPTSFVPDALVVASSSRPASASLIGAGENAYSGNVAECVVPISEERTESFLVIRAADSREVVTVLELLSPSNKRAGGAGRREYLAKRDEILRSRSHLIEIDLLRGGDRMPLLGATPSGDYFVMVSRRETRPRVRMHSWTLRDRMPSVNVPLHRGDDDAHLDLQRAFETTYERAKYGRSIDYGAGLIPPLGADDAIWVAGLLPAK